MSKLLSALLLLLLISCTAKIHYVGQRNRPTTHVDVYVTEAAILKNFVITGQGYLNYRAVFMRPDKIQALAEKKARENGADGIVLSDYYIPNTGQAINTVYRTDTIEKGIISTGSTTITPISTSGLRVYFIKYQN